MNLSINNKKEVIWAKFMLIRIPLLLFIGILVVYLFFEWKMPWLLFTTGGLFVICLLITLVFKLHFFQCDISESSVRIRFYHLFPLIREFRIIEVENTALEAAKINKRMGGRLISLSLSELTTEGVAVYPEIPLSFIGQAALVQLEQTLSKRSE